jgi:hypothetical protein
MHQELTAVVVDGAGKTQRESRSPERRGPLVRAPLTLPSRAAVPEIRFNIVTRESVIIAVERAKRPEELAPSRPPSRPQPPMWPTVPSARATSI